MTRKPTKGKPGADDNYSTPPHAVNLFGDRYGSRARPTVRHRCPDALGVPYCSREPVGIFLFTHGTQFPLHAPPE